MKSVYSFALTAAFALAALVPPLPAIAAPPRVKGELCYFPVEPGTWVGFFDGGKRQTAWNGREYTHQVTFWRCFRTKAQCTAWKYWVQTDFPDGPNLTWCRRK
jgi:hypothetical protein